MTSLRHLRVALLEGRMAEQTAALVDRFGGVPYSVQAAREAVHLERVAPFLDRLSSGQISAVVFLTGLGASALLREAARLERLNEVVAGLRSTTTVCRGPKPAAVLSSYGITVSVAAAAPYTTRELIEALAPVEVADRLVAVVRQGGSNQSFTNALEARGARIDDLSLYEWVLPEDLDPMRHLVHEVIAGQVDAIAFTNRIQARHLLEVATGLGLTAQFTDALDGRVIVAAVGPVCAEALQAFGVTPDVMPAQPTTEAMIAALADYVELTDYRPRA